MADPIDDLINGLTGGGDGGGSTIVEENRAPQQRTVFNPATGNMEYQQWDPATQQWVDTGVIASRPPAGSSTTVINEPVSSQGVFSREELDKMVADNGGTWNASRTTASFPDGSILQADPIRNRDGSVRWNITDKTPAKSEAAKKSGLSNAAIAAIQGATGAARGAGGVAAPAAGGGSFAAPAPAGRGLFGLPNVGPDDVVAPTATNAGEPNTLVGFVQKYLLGNQPNIGELADRYPIVQGANPSMGPGAGFGFTPVPGTENAGTNVQFGGQIGNVGVGTGFAPLPISAALGGGVTGNVLQDTGQALAAMQARQDLLNSPLVAAEAERTGINPNAVAQRQFEAANGLSAQGRAFAPIFQVDRGNGPEFFDAMGVRQVTTGTASRTPGGKTTLKPAVGSVFGDEALPSAINQFGEEDVWAARGVAGVTTRPTNIRTSEFGQPEAVFVKPLGEPRGVPSVTPRSPVFDPGETFADPFGLPGPALGFDPNHFLSRGFDPETGERLDQFEHGGEMGGQGGLWRLTQALADADYMARREPRIAQNQAWELQRRFGSAFATPQPYAINPARGAIPTGPAAAARRSNPLAGMVSGRGGQALQMLMAS